MTLVSITSIGWGNHGIMQTLDMMASLIDSGSDSPDVVDLARTLAVTGGVRQPYVQAVMIRNWLAAVWRYVDDPLERELLVSPETLLKSFQRNGFIAGDCDEAAVMGAALGKAIGLRATLTVLAFQGDDGRDDQYSHVFASLLTDSEQEVTLDVTRPRGPVPSVTRSLTVAV